MGILHSHSVKCRACGNIFDAEFTNSVNVTRFPEQKLDILSDDFHRAHCGKCGERQTIEAEFQYIDLENTFFAKVFPRKERHFHRVATTSMSTALSSAAGLDPSYLTRVVFGLEELKEKIRIVDFDLDDRLIELFKLYIIQEHPFIIQKRRLRIHFSDMDHEKLTFRISFDHEETEFNAFAPRPAYDALVAQKDQAIELVNSAHSTDSIFSQGDADWINLWRWSPHTDALKSLSDFARTVREGGKIALTGDPFTDMLTTLPRGNQLPSWAKRDLGDLKRYALKKNATRIQDALFEIRFGKDLEDDWMASHNPDTIATIWDLLDGLPDANVEGNVWIDSIKQENSVSQYWEKEIHINSGLTAGDPSFELTLLHEVGHAVHHQLDVEQNNLVSDWLTRRFGWEVFAPGEVDDWVTLLGGYRTSSAQDISSLREGLLGSLGKDSMNAPKLHPGTIGDVWSNVTNPHLLRQVAQESTDDWWTNSHNWKTHGGRAFYLNHWYHSFMTVSVQTLALLQTLGIDNYAAMSPPEFFAEIYAMRFSLGAAGTSMWPADIIAWLDQQIGPPD